MSDSVQPRRRQPTRLAVPGILQARTLEWLGLPFPSPMYENEKWKWSRSVLSDSSRPHGLQPTRLLCPWDFPGKSTGVGRHCLLWTRSMSFSNLKRPWRMWIKKKMIIKHKWICYFSENVWSLWKGHLKPRKWWTPCTWAVQCYVYVVTKIHMAEKETHFLVGGNVLKRCSTKGQPH